MVAPFSIRESCAIVYAEISTRSATAQFLEDASGPDHRVFSDYCVSEQLSERLDDRIHPNLDLRIHEYGFRPPYGDSREHQFARLAFPEDVIDNRKFDPRIDSKEFVGFAVQQSAH